MRDITSIRLELGISAEKLVSQVLVDNRNLEEALTKGLKKGLEEFLLDEKLEDIIALQVKESISETIKEAARSYALKHKIHEAIFNQLDEKVGAIAKGWGDKLMDQIEPKKKTVRPTRRKK